MCPRHYNNAACSVRLIINSELNPVTESKQGTSPLPLLIVSCSDVVGEGVKIYFSVQIQWE